MHHLAWPLAVAALTLLAGCGPDEDKPKDGPGVLRKRLRGSKPNVWTTFYPTTEFARLIGGEKVNVHCPVPADADPIFWKPTRQAIAGYQDADLIILNGAEFEKWVETANLPQSKILNTALGFKSEWVRYEGTGGEHKHGPDGEKHTHTGIDGHTWLDPILAKQQAAAIRDGLIRLQPKHEKTFRQNYNALAGDLDRLDEAFKKLPVKQALYANHPAYNYLAKRYGWKIVNFDLDPEFAPTKEQLAEIAAKIKTTPGKLMLWESAPTKEVAQAIQTATGLKSIEFSPCEAKPDGDGYTATMRTSIQNLATALSR